MGRQVTAEDVAVQLEPLAGVQDSAGDPLTLTLLFGICDPTAIRSCLELGPLDQRFGPPSPQPEP